MKEEEKLYHNSFGRLFRVLKDAYVQAAVGKGAERHQERVDQPFTEQPIFWIEQHFSSYQLGQAVKKLHESQGLQGESAEAELLGAIIYIAARVLFLREQQVCSKSEQSTEPSEVL